jgi:hypothetical protein
MPLKINLRPKLKMGVRRFTERTPKFYSYDADITTT